MEDYLNVDLSEEQVDLIEEALRTLYANTWTAVDLEKIENAIAALGREI